MMHGQQNINFAVVSRVKTHVFHICCYPLSITEGGERKAREMRLHEGGKACVNTSCFNVFERTIDRSHVGASLCFVSDLRTIPSRSKQNKYFIVCKVIVVKSLVRIRHTALRSLLRRETFIASCSHYVTRVLDFT
jgi:hypothetical protein